MNPVANGIKVLFGQVSRAGAGGFVNNQLNEGSGADQPIALMLLDEGFR